MQDTETPPIVPDVLISKDHLLAPDALERETVHVPEWEASVIVQELSGTLRDVFESKCTEARLKTQNTGKVDLDSLKAILVCLSIIDPAGDPVLTPADAPALNAKSGSAINRLFQVASRLSNLNDGAIAELAKN